MSYPIDKAAGDTIDSAHINEIRDQIVFIFDDASDRNAEIASPAEGQACWLKDTPELQVYNGVAWRAPWNLPWGRVAHQTTAAVVTVNQATATLITVNFTAVTNRYYKVTFNGHFRANGATPAIYEVWARLDGTVIDKFAIEAGTLSANCCGTTGVFTATAGSRTFDVRYEYVGGGQAGDYFDGGLTTSRLKLIVEDVGPSDVPA